MTLGLCQKVLRKCPPKPEQNFCTCIAGYVEIPRTVLCIWFGLILYSLVSSRFDPAKGHNSAVALRIVGRGNDFVHQGLRIWLRMASCIHRIRDSTKPHLTGCMKRFQEDSLRSKYLQALKMVPPSHWFCEGEVCPNVLLQSEFLCPGVFCRDAIHHEVAGIFGHWADDMFSQQPRDQSFASMKIIAQNPVGLWMQEASGKPKGPKLSKVVYRFLPKEILQQYSNV